MNIIIIFATCSAIGLSICIYVAISLYRQHKNKNRLHPVNTLSYKGYTGSVAFSETDNIFFGKIEGIDSLITFKGESVSELKRSFHQAVDEYIACNKAAHVLGHTNA